MDKVKKAIKDAYVLFGAIDQNPKRRYVLAQVRADLMVALCELNAPVVLPEPVAYLHPKETCATTDIWYKSAGWQPLYTEQQVRALLATGGQAQADTRDARKSGCAESNRYCHASMCLDGDAEHEHDCPAGRAAIAAAKGGAAVSTTFEQGWAAHPFKEQFPQLQDSDAERLDKLNHAITLLRVNGMLTDSAHRDIREKKLPKAVEAALNSSAKAERTQNDYRI